MGAVQVDRDLRKHSDMGYQTMNTLPKTLLAALFGVLAFSGAVHASCTGSNRVSLNSAGCLSGGWTNTCQDSIFGHCTGYHSSYWVQASADCVTGGNKVVAKIDLKSDTDRTWHLANSNQRNGNSTTRTNGVYCCSDLGRCD